MRAPLPCAIAMTIAAGLLFAGCVDVIDHGRAPCNASTCSGCCTSNGVCLSGGNVFACGVNAATCDVCTGDEICASGACVIPGAQAGINPGGGNGDASCGPQTCGGCCANGTCVALADETDAYCGQYGMACRACGGASSCSAGYCETPVGCRLVTSIAHANGFGLIDFGDTPVGATTRVDVTLKNTGDTACALTAPAWLTGSDENAFGFGGQPTYASTIAPGETTKLTVTFTPYAAGSWSDYSDAFTFTANDDAPSECASGEPGCRRVVVMGNGLANAFTPRAPLVPETVAFGDVTSGCESGWRPVILVNEGSQPLALSAASVTGAGFELQPMQLPATVAPWATLTVYVRFVPAASQSGAQVGALSLTDSIGGTRQLELSATSVSSSARTETFVQQPGSFADVLFVVSNGGTMQQTQTDLGSALSGFWMDALSRGGSVHAGVVSTDVSLGNAGLLQGSPKYVTPSTPNAVDALSSNARVGVAGTLDQALEATRLAVTPPNSDDVLRNGGFLRGEARLGVVFVSDSADKSGASLDDYAEVFRAVAGAHLQDKVRAYAIAPSSQCQSGGRYKELVSQLGGSCQALGAQAMSTQLQAVSTDLFRERDEYTLAQPVDALQSVSVVVDGTPLPSSQFVLDTAHNSVHFAANAVPEAGQTFAVTYAAACHP